jgi:hypothetical protein
LGGFSVIEMDLAGKRIPSFKEIFEGVVCREASWKRQSKACYAFSPWVPLLGVSLVVVNPREVNFVRSTSAPEGASFGIEKDLFRGELSPIGEESQFF